MQVKVENLPKSTIKLTITVPAADVQKTYNKVIDAKVADTQVEGFRKGKAPREMVIEKVGENTIQADAINDILRNFYPQALKEHKLLPISNPQVEIDKFDPNEEITFSATFAVRPEVKIGEYNSKLDEEYKKLADHRKKQNEQALKEGKEMDNSHIHLNPNLLINIISESSEVEVPGILVEEETDRMMARLLDQAQQIGLSIEQYLKAQNKTADQLRGEYADLASRNLKAEFVLGHLVVERKVEVTDEEIEEAYKAAGYEFSEENPIDPTQRMYIKSILQKNKLITNLIEEVEERNADTKK